MVEFNNALVGFVLTSSYEEGKRAVPIAQAYIKTMSHMADFAFASFLKQVSVAASVRKAR